MEITIFFFYTSANDVIACTVRASYTAVYLQVLACVVGRFCTWVIAFCWYGARPRAFFTSSYADNGLKQIACEKLDF